MTRLKPAIPHLIALGIFIVISLTYFSPALEGKKVRQGDIIQFKGMSKEITDYESTGDEKILWINNMFGGMPTYQITTPKPSIILRKIFKVFNFLGGVAPANYLFIYLIGFYIALLAFKVNPWLAIIGALAYAFSSYFFVILEAGHNTKAYALGFMPPIVAGVYIAFKGKYVLGSFMVGLFLALQLYINHLQITYYTMLIIIVLGVVQLIQSIKEKTYRNLAIAVSTLSLAVLLAIGSNLTLFWTTYEYSKYSIRGKSELDDENNNHTSGLDKDYATQWSYGIDETMNLFIPSFMGGSSNLSISENSKTYEYLYQSYLQEYQQYQNRTQLAVQSARQSIRALPMYWGDKAFTSGPVYVGAIIIFLFVFALFTLKGPLKWWLVSATILSVMLAWGRHFMILTNLFLEYFPAYNKFRTVEMILVIAEFTIPLLGIIAIQKFIKGEIEKTRIVKGLKYSFYITGGVALFFILFAGAFDFTGMGDQRYLAQGREAFVDAMREDRKTLLRLDAVRSLIFVGLAAALLYAYFLKKIKINVFLLALGFLILADMWTVNKRYLNNDSFVPKREAAVPYQPYDADLEILQDNDPHYRVYDQLADPFRNGRTSYFHKSLGGYHGAKLRRYQDVVDRHLRQNNMRVLNMLNTRYFIVRGQENIPQKITNPGALGNAWIVPSFLIVDNPNDEIDALGDFSPAFEAIIDKRFSMHVESLQPGIDSSAAVRLAEYHPNHLKYNFQSNRDQLVVFSEIYYEKGWNAYIDGNPAPHFRVNYILRGMVIPAGKHEIFFEFKPASYYASINVSLISSIMLILLLISTIYLEISKNMNIPRKYGRQVKLQKK